MKPIFRVALFVLVVFSVSPIAQAPRVTAPKEEFGFNFGDDYQLATYQQLAAYWQKLDRESDRMVLQEIGRTSEGRPHLMAIVTSPENHKNLARIKDTSRRLALAENLTDDQARALARDGKTVVWIDGGLHASEVLGAQQLGEMVYQMVSRTDEETMRFLNDTVILFVHANPDGHDLVAGWYMRNPVPEKRSPAGLPLLYHHYIGHDNNRDFFASTQKETENINRVLYHEWSPQILYNHHQSGPAGTVFWSPPFRDPFNYNYDPMLVLGLQQLGLTIHARMAAESKPGAASRAAGAYDGWWNGGIRNTAAFHNVLAILTEMIGSPTPMRIPFVLQRQLPTSDLTFPIAPQLWHFRQSIEYSLTANRAVLDFASRWRETVLFNAYQMGRNSIARGSTDTWTVAPHRYTAVATKLGVPAAGGGGGGGGAANPERDAAVMAAIRDPQFRDPRGYIIPSSQADFPTAVKFINALARGRHQGAARDARVRGAGQKVPGRIVRRDGRAIVPAARHRHVRAAGSSGQHSVRRRRADAAVRSRRLDAGVPDGRGVRSHSRRLHRAVRAGHRLEREAAGGQGDDRSTAPPVTCSVTRWWIRLSRSIGCSKANEEVYWLPDGTWYVPAQAVDAGRRSRRSPSISALARRRRPTSRPPARGNCAARASGCGINTAARWTPAGRGGFSSSTSSRSRRCFAPTLDAGNLNAKYDVIVFVEGGIPAVGAGAGARATGCRRHSGGVSPDARAA